MMHISEDDRRRLSEAVASVEKRTSAHFALVITPLSERYAHFPLLWAAGVAMGAGGVIAIIWPQMPFGTGFMIEAVTFTGLALIFDWMPLRLLFVPKRTKKEHCVELAHREFAARVLADHEHRPGMLFFVSLGERHVQILADNALHLRVGQDAWDRVVADFVSGMKGTRRTVDGLLASIDACGSMLQEHFPR